MQAWKIVGSRYPASVADDLERSIGSRFITPSRTPRPVGLATAHRHSKHAGRGMEPMPEHRPGEIA